MSPHRETEPVLGRVGVRCNVYEFCRERKFGICNETLKTTRQRIQPYTERSGQTFYDNPDVSGYWTSSSVCSAE